jgi:hypothetical protein
MAGAFHRHGGRAPDPKRLERLKDLLKRTGNDAKKCADVLGVADSTVRMARDTGRVSAGLLAKVEAALAAMGDAGQ